jgi:hypothetical protein
MSNVEQNQDETTYFEQTKTDSMTNQRVIKALR